MRLEHLLSSPGPFHRALTASILASVVFTLTVTVPDDAGAAPGTAPQYVNYAQCANGAPPSTSLGCPQGWINGILQGSNSHYGEDQVTPQRASVNLPGGKLTGRTLTFTYQTRKGTIHAYDSLATWNLTQTAADRCAGLSAADCVGGSPTTFPIPNDPAQVFPVSNGYSATTTGHMIPAGPGRVFTFYGGTITSVSTPTHSCLAPCKGDDYATITITYSVPSVPRKVQLLFGGHLAATGGPRGWGSGLGSANISGGPYHIKWTKADGASIGNRDNQISGAAILAPPALTVTKTADAATVPAGSPIGFTVTVANNGTGTATGVTLNDPLPGGTGIDWSISPAYAGPGTCSITGSPPTETLSCSFGDLAAGASVSVHVSSQTTSSTSGTFNNTATAQATNAPPASGSASTTVQKPSLAITKTADNATVNAGDPIGFTISVSNGGPGVAKNVTLNDPLPGGTGIDWSISPAYAGPGTCSITGSPPNETLSCSFGDLASGASVSVHVSSQTTSATSGTFNNTATVQASNNPPVSSTTSTTVNKPNLTVTKTADNAAVSAGDPIGFTVTVSNTGTGVAKSVTLNDPLPGGTGIDWSISPAYSGPGTCSITGSPPTETLTCSFGDLASSASASVHVSSQTTSSTSGEFPNTATAQGSNHPPVTGSATTRVDQPGLTALKTADNATVNSGEAIGFTITVTNTGTGVAKSVTLNDPLPGGTGIDWSISPAYSGPGTCSITGSPPNETLTCSFGNLASGASVSVHVSSQTTSATSGTFNNTATAQGSNAPPVTSTATTTVLKPNLTVAKTADNASVDSTEPIGFTITVSNSGPGVAKGVTLNDPLPGGTGIDWSISPAYSGPGTCSITGSPPNETLSCSFGDLASGASASVHVSSQTTSATSGTFNNTATAQASNHPPVTGSASTTVKKPSLVATKTADSASVSSGDTIGFTITVTNNGPGTAIAATLSDPLPGGAGIDWSISPAYSGPGTCSISGSPPTETLSCAFGNLASGASVSIHVSSATTTATSGVLNNTVTAQASNHPPVTASASIEVKQPVLTIAKTADQSPVNANDTIGFTITVGNSGTGTAKAVTLNDPLPGGAGIDWSISPAYSGPGTCSITGSPPTETLSCSFGDLAPGATVSVHVSSATTEATEGTFANTATAKASNHGDVQASATIVVRRAKLEVSKEECPTTVAPGGTLRYTISYSNTGTAPATSTTLVDTIPVGTQITDPGDGTVSPDGQTISWNLGTLAVGATGSKVFFVSVPATADGTTLVNTATLDSPDAPAATTTIDTLVSENLASSSGRAYGLEASLLGGTLEQEPIPDTAVENPDTVQTVDVAGVHADILSVTETGGVANGVAQDEAIATAAGVSVTVEGLSVQASALVARSISSASATDAGSSSGGSRVEKLVINGTSYGDMFSPKTIVVNDPLTGVRIGQVDVLRSTKTGDAAGELQPASDLFRSGLTVEALRILVDDVAATTLIDESSIVVVSSAATAAQFPSGLPCGTSIPSVRGDAYALDTPNLNPPAGQVQVGLVTLGSTGGNETGSVLDLSELGTATGTTHTEGTLTPLQVSSFAELDNLNLLSGAITATTVRSESETTGATPSGSTIIEDLQIAGTDVCATLGLTGTCQPDPDTVLVLDDGNVIVVLNEQILSGSSLHVNAVHIFVIGEGNPLGLPVGAEIVLSSAFSGTSP